MCNQKLVKIAAILGAIAAAVLFFFAVIFALASSYIGIPTQTAQMRLIISVFLFIIGIVLLVGIYFITRKPKTVIQRLEVSGKMQAAQIKCPKCGASINASEIQIISGVPYVKCPYCGMTLEVTEEPKW